MGLILKLPQVCIQVLYQVGKFPVSPGISCMDALKMNCLILLFDKSLIFNHFYCKNLEHFNRPYVEEATKQGKGIHVGVAGLASFVYVCMLKK